MHHIQCLQTHQHVWWETTNWQSWLLRMKQKGEATIQWFWEHASKEKPWHVAGVLTAMAQHIGGAYSMLQRPAALIAGGETTVTLTPNSAGKGGQKSKNWLWQRRCNVDHLGLRNVVLASAGTDGTDGPTDAAGGRS
jgi:hypothetical protein